MFYIIFSSQYEIGHVYESFSQKNKSILINNIVTAVTFTEKNYY